MDLLTLNHTIFSEESGEIALGTLTALQPPHSNLAVTRQYWQLIRMRYNQLHGDDAVERRHIQRELGIPILVLHFGF